MSLRRWGLRAALTMASCGGLLAGSVAFAEWLATGTGEAGARAGRAHELSASSASPTGDLFPGASGPVAVTLHNPNPFDVEVTAIRGDGPIISDTAGCDPTNHGVTFIDQTELSLVVPGNGSLGVELAEAATMAATSADACQGAVFTIPIAINTGGGSEPPADGTPCDDGNPNTTDDAYQDGDCVGTPMPADGTACDDGDPNTVGETYTDGVCGGGTPTS